MPNVRPLRILVVDDDAELRDVLAQAFADDGYDVVTARNGAEALEHVRPGSPRLDLVLLDLMMPVMDGWTFLRECGSMPSCADIPVVVLSAAYRVRELGLENVQNVHAAVAKPFDLGILLTLAARLMRNKNSPEQCCGW